MARKAAAPEPLIAPQRPEEKETLNVQIARSVMNDLDAYCRFLDGSGKGYVVQEMIRRTIQADRAFAEWLRLSPEPPVKTMATGK